MKPFYVRSEGISHDKQQELLDLAVDAGALPYDGREPYSAKYQYTNNYDGAYTYIGVADSKTMLANISEQCGPEAVKMTYKQAWDYLQSLLSGKGDNPELSKSDGSTASYYELPEGCAELQELISYRNMNAQDGEMFRALYRKGLASHSDEMRDAKKILFYAKAEVERLEKYGK